MPEYVATLARNERHYSQWLFTAESDQKAVALLKEGEAAGTIPWGPDEDSAMPTPSTRSFGSTAAADRAEHAKRSPTRSSFLAGSIMRLLNASPSRLRLWRSKTLMPTPERHSIL